MAAFALPVAADELSDFESARRSYDRQSYAKAARGLESLVGGVVPRAANPVVRLEARKYLGATYLFLGKKDAAREQFRLLLEEDPDYDIDPVAFPEAVVQTFQEVQEKVTAERARRELSEVSEPSALEEWRITYLGRKGCLTEVLRSLGEVPPDGIFKGVFSDKEIAKLRSGEWWSTPQL